MTNPQPEASKGGRRSKVVTAASMPIPRSEETIEDMIDDLIPVHRQDDFKARLNSLVLGIIGEDEEVPSMEEYVEYRGGALNIEDDDNPEIEATARNELRAEQRAKLKELTGGR